jgi:DnaK suppressor protein
MNDNKYVTVPQGYSPSDDEPFMGVMMKSYFREKLLAWKTDLMGQTKDTMENLKQESVSHPDAIDRASATADRQLELRTRDRLRKLIVKIDKGLSRIEFGTYGYCDETGDPIRVGRLEARLVATLSIEAQEMRERGKRTRA